LIDGLFYLFIFAADIACNDPQFSTLCSFVVKADLVDKLNSKNPFPQRTVFAPTNDAFSRLSEETLEALNDTDALVDVLLYHIAPRKIMSDDLECGLSTEMASSASTTTLCGKNGTFYQAGGGITAGLPQIIAADIETCYGVIHVIDEVLLPG
jgi:transforming growth factor-beta-induced protein